MILLFLKTYWHNARTFIEAIFFVLGFVGLFLGHKINFPYEIIILLFIVAIFYASYRTWLYEYLKGVRLGKANASKVIYELDSTINRINFEEDFLILEKEKKQTEKSIEEVKREGSITNFLFILSKDDLENYWDKLISYEKELLDIRDKMINIRHINVSIKNEGIEPDESLLVKIYSPEKSIFMTSEDIDTQKPEFPQKDGDWLIPKASLFPMIKTAGNTYSSFERGVRFEKNIIEVDMTQLHQKDCVQLIPGGFYVKSEDSNLEKNIKVEIRSKKSKGVIYKTISINF